MTIEKIVGLMMIGIATVGVVSIVKQCMGNWGSTVLTIVLSIVSTIWIVVGGYLLFDSEEVVMGTVYRSEIERVSKDLCYSLHAAYGRDITSEKKTDCLKASEKSLIELLESKGYVVKGDSNGR
jgi:hypothetical protein